ncbi:MAG: ATP-binding protein [Eubacteriales bacterium]
MKELSLHILDIAENSVRANATRIDIDIRETEHRLTFTVRDNGHGMTEDFLRTVIDPFATTRTTRSVGLGIPLLKLAAEQSGGSLRITSRHISEHPDHGTTLCADFDKTSIDYVPLGNMAETVCTLLQGRPQIDFVFTHICGAHTAELDTRELRQVLGDVPLNTPEVLDWVKSSLCEAYHNFK